MFTIDYTSDNQENGIIYTLAEHESAIYTGHRNIIIKWRENIINVKIPLHYNRDLPISMISYNSYLYVSTEGDRLYKIFRDEIVEIINLCNHLCNFIIHNGYLYCMNTSRYYLIKLLCEHPDYDADNIGSDCSDNSYSSYYIDNDSACYQNYFLPDPSSTAKSLVSDGTYIYVDNGTLSIWYKDEKIRTVHYDECNLSFMNVVGNRVYAGDDHDGSFGYFNTYDGDNWQYQWTNVYISNDRVDHTAYKYNRFYEFIVVDNTVYQIKSQALFHDNMRVIELGFNIKCSLVVTQPNTAVYLTHDGNLTKISKRIVPSAATYWRQKLAMRARMLTTALVVARFGGNRDIASEIFRHI